MCPRRRWCGRGCFSARSPHDCARAGTRRRRPRCGRPAFRRGEVAVPSLASWVRVWRRSGGPPGRRSTRPPRRRRCCGARIRTGRPSTASAPFVRGSPPSLRRRRAGADGCRVRSREYRSGLPALARVIRTAWRRALVGYRDLLRRLRARLSATPVGSGHRRGGRGRGAPALGRARQPCSGEPALSAAARVGRPRCSRSRMSDFAWCVCMASGQSSRARRLVAIERLVHVIADGSSQSWRGRYDSCAADRPGYCDQNIDDLLHAGAGRERRLDDGLIRSGGCSTAISAASRNRARICASRWPTATSASVCASTEASSRSSLTASLCNVCS